GPLLVRLAGVAQAQALRGELGARDELVQLVQRLARAPPRLGRPGEERRAEAIEPEELGRAAPELDPGERGDRDHLAVPAADVEPADVLRRPAEGRLRLRLHPVGPA